MNNSGEDYCRRDRLSYRQNNQIPGAASATDRYHIPSYEPSSNIRNLPAYVSVCDSRRLHPSLTPSPLVSYDVDDSQNRNLLSSFNISDKYHVHSTYDLNNHRLPPLPPSPNHYVLDTEEPFIPPPDCYLSPPAPAPPDRFQNPLISHDRFLLSTTDLYTSPSSFAIDKYKSSNVEQMYDPYSVTDKYGNSPSPESILERYTDRYGSPSYCGNSGDPYVRRDTNNHNYHRSLNFGYYHQKSNYSSQRFLPQNVRSSPHNQFQTLRFQKCCNISYNSRDNSQSRAVSPGAQSRIHSGRTSSPVSLLSSAAAASIPVDFINSSANNGRYLSSSFSSTLPRCNSYGDVQCNPSTNVTLRRTSTGHENCCYKRRTSSPSSSISYPPHPVSFPAITSTASTSSSATSLNSQNFQQPPSLISTW